MARLRTRRSRARKSRTRKSRTRHINRFKKQYYLGGRSRRYKNKRLRKSRKKNKKYGGTSQADQEEMAAAAGKGMRRMSSAQYRGLSPVSEESVKEQLKSAWVHINQLEKSYQDIDALRSPQALHKEQEMVSRIEQLEQGRATTAQKAEIEKLKAAQALLLRERQLLSALEAVKIEQTKAAIEQEGLWALWSQKYEDILGTGLSETSIPMHIVKLMDD